MRNRSLISRVCLGSLPPRESPALAVSLAMMISEYSNALAKQNLTSDSI